MRIYDEGWAQSELDEALRERGIDPEDVPSGVEEKYLYSPTPERAAELIDYDLNGEP